MPLGLFSAARDEVLEKSLDRAVLLDLKLQVGTKAGYKTSGDGAWDLLSRRFPGFMILFDKESLIKRFVGCVCVFHKSVLERVVAVLGNRSQKVIVVRGHSVFQDDIDLFGRPSFFTSLALEVAHDVKGIAIQADELKLYFLHCS